MRIWRRLKPLILLLILALIQFGCDSSREDFVVVSDGTPTQFAPVSIAGQVAPGALMADVPVTLIGEDGAVLAQTTTDETGAFLFRAFQGPSRFQAVANLPSGLVLRNLVDDNEGGRFVVLNIPTTLAAELAEREGLSPSQAKARTAVFLGLQHAVDLEFGLSELNPGKFSHLKFFLEVAANGGAEAFLGQLLEQVRSGNTTARFTLDLPDLEAALQSVPPELLSHFQTLQRNPVLRRAILAEKLRQAPFMAGLIIDGADHSPPEMLNSQTVLNSGVNARLADTLLDKAKEVAWTHLADAAGLNYGDSAALEEIQAQLNDVLTILSSIKISIDGNSLDLAVSQLFASAIDIIKVNNDKLLDLELPTGPEAPFTPSDDTAKVLAALQSLDITEALVDIQNAIDPQGTGTKILVSGQSYILTDLYGQNLTQDTGNFPFRTNDLLDQIFSISDYYAQYQQLGINLLGESAHVQTNPTSSIITAKRVSLDTLASIYRQRGVVPPSRKVPDNVLVDLQGGLMWYSTIIGSKSNSDANSYANSFSVSDGAGGSYTDWRVPTAEEYRLLRDRARLVDTSLRDNSVAHDGSDSSYGNFGYSAQGLTALGISNANILNSDGSVIYASYTLVNGSGGDPDRYQLNGTGAFSQNTQFRFNHQNSDIQETTNQRPFFMVRSIGEPVVPIVNTGLVGVDDTNAAIPFTWTPVTDAEFEFFGRVTGAKNHVFLVPQGSDNQLPDRVGASLNYGFAIGGTFNIGSTNLSRTFPRRQQNSTGNYPTYNGPASAYTGVNSRAQLVSFSSTNMDVEVLPTGYLNWRGSGFGAFGLEIISNIYDTGGDTVTFTGSPTSPVSSTRQLRQVQIFPRNRSYNLISTTGVTEQYSCLAFYSDSTVEDVTSSATWTIVDDETGQPVPTKVDPMSGQTVGVVRFSKDSPGLLVIDNDIAVPLFPRIEVSIGTSNNQKDQTVVKAITQ